MWEIEVRRGPTSQVPVNAVSIPFPESRVNTGTVHVRVDMPTVVRIPRRNGSPTMLLWT